MTSQAPDLVDLKNLDMSKFEKQMQLLKDKAKEQENKPNNEDRIIKMEAQDEELLKKGPEDVKNIEN